VLPGAPRPLGPGGEVASVVVCGSWEGGGDQMTVSWTLASSPCVFPRLCRLRGGWLRCCLRSLCSQGISAVSGRGPQLCSGLASPASKLAPAEHRPSPTVGPGCWARRPLGTSSPPAPASNVPPGGVGLDGAEREGNHLFPPRPPKTIGWCACPGLEISLVM